MLSRIAVQRSTLRPKACDAVLSRSSPRLSRAQAAFKYLDSDRSGTVSRQEMKRMIWAFNLSDVSEQAMDVRASARRVRTHGLYTGWRQTGDRGLS